MRAPSPVESFVRLFRGRSDAYGSWRGGCVREPLTPSHFQHHLTSDDPDDWIGVYNVIGTRCSWGCVDIDVSDFPLARNIRLALHQRGIPAWVEQTTHGYHVWVFPAEPLVPAGTMRRALTAACRAVGYTPKEVFPKQNRVTGKGLGNYVRLPFNGFCSAGTHRVRLFMEWTEADTAWFTLGEFLAEMDKGRATTSALADAAAVLPEPRTTDIDIDREAGLEFEPLIANLGGLAYRIWRDGPLHGNDRSTTLVHLARLCAEGGCPPAATLAVVRSADDRWGKNFSDRGEPGAEILDRIVRKAHAGVVADQPWPLPEGAPL